MMKILIIAEHNNQSLKLSTHHTVSAAMELGNEIDLLVIGSECQPVVTQACLIPAIKQVIVVDNTIYAHQLAENCATLIA